MEDRQVARDKELIELVSRQFLQLFRSQQANTDSHCPNAFVLRQAGVLQTLSGEHGERSAIDIVRTAELQLLCQSPTGWHETETGGRYRLVSAGALIRGALPYMRHLTAILKFTLRAGPITLDLQKHLGSELAFMNTCLDALAGDKSILGLDAADASLVTAEGPSLRMLRKLLDNLDPVQHWGGLRKVLTPEGHFLWLCEAHKREYES